MGLVILTFGVKDRNVLGLVFLRLVLRDSYVWGLASLTFRG